ncbi:serine protease [Aerococcaceae bacterium DSM 111020]|nr:serine protease [Aerococcaceae bacterium DSM 111020]
MNKRIIKFLIMLGVMMTFPLWDPPLNDLIVQFTNQVSESRDYHFKRLPAFQSNSDTKMIEASDRIVVGGIQLGEPRERVEYIHQSQDESLNEYSFKWTSYHHNYDDFMMIMYDSTNQVNGIYTNQDIFDLPFDISYGTTQQVVREKLGTPLEYIEKGNTHYLITSDGEYDVYWINNQFVTLFYDKYQDSIVTAVQIIDDALEIQFDQLYANASLELSDAFDRQLFDIVNAERNQRGLSILEWSQEAANTAYNHSQDMAENQYFNHINLEGASPFDRLSKDNIIFSLAAENLAFGQKSSIYAHQGLMNSEGHRENILLTDVTQLGIGVSFDVSNQPYYTQLFYAN